MATATRIRAEKTAAGARVRMLMGHEMETGQRKDGDGRTIPAWFIQEVVVTLNGAPAFTWQCGTAVSKNPFLEFTLRGAKPGDRIGVRWIDNRGDSRSDEAVVA